MLGATSRREADWLTVQRERIDVGEDRRVRCADATSLVASFMSTDELH